MFNKISAIWRNFELEESKANINRHFEKRLIWHENYIYNFEIQKEVD